VIQCESGPMRADNTASTLTTTPSSEETRVMAECQDTRNLPGMLFKSAKGRCRGCRKAFTYARIGGRLRLYCGDVCSDRFRRVRSNKRKPLPDCPCGAKATGPYSKFCSVCRGKRREANLPGKTGLPHIACLECGKVVESRDIGKKYCSKRCQDRVACRNKVHRRRKAECESGEVITKKQLWDIQLGKCGICGELIDLEIRYPDQQSASIDHITPLSKGGPHTLENCQLAHCFCNSRKHDKMTEGVLF
jgi:hypothetical protein